MIMVATLHPILSWTGSMAQAIAGISARPPSLLLKLDHPIAIARLRLNQLLSMVMSGSQPPKPLAQRDHHVDGVKHEWGYDGLHEVRQEVKRQVTQEGNVLRGFNLAEEQPADAHDHHSDEHHPARAQLIDQVALDRAEDPALDAGECESEG